MSETLNIMSTLPDPRSIEDERPAIEMSVFLELIGLKNRVAQLEAELQSQRKYLEAHIWLQTALESQLHTLKEKAKIAYKKSDYNSPFLVHYFPENDNRSGEIDIFKLHVGAEVVRELIKLFRLKQRYGGYEWLRPSTIDLLIQVYGRMEIVLPDEQLVELWDLQAETKMPHANLVVLNTMKRTQEHSIKNLRERLTDTTGDPDNSEQLRYYQEELAAELAVIQSNIDKNLLTVAWNDVQKSDGEPSLSPNGILLILTVYGVEQLIADQDLRREIMLLQRLDEEKPMEEETILAIYRTLKNVVEWQVAQEKNDA